jgi:lipase chaperone LimK
MKHPCEERTMATPDTSTKTCRNVILIPALALILVALGLLLLTLPGNTGAPTPIPSESGVVKAESLEPDLQGAARINQNVYATAVESLPKPGPLPNSLQGSHHDVTLKADAAGNLVIEPHILHLFDFYLSALVEEPLEAILARINYDLAHQLDGTALDQARDLLRRYIDYKIALVELDSVPTMTDTQGTYALDTLAERQQQLHALRQTHFNEPEMTAFFEQETLQDHFMMQYVAIVQAHDLDASEKQLALAQLEQKLPEPIRQAREETVKHTQLFEAAEALKSGGASAEELFQLRAQTLGEEAAANLAALDQQQAHWQQRLADYANERNAIRQSGLSADDQEIAINSVIERRFSGTEQLRVRALDPHL